MTPEVKAFLRRMAVLTARAKERGISVELVPPDYGPQVEGMAAMVRVGTLQSGGVIRVDGTTLLAYLDPQHPNINSYLAWRDGAWTTPETEERAAIMLYDGPFERA